MLNHSAMGAIAYLEHFAWQDSRLGLERIRELTARMGNPQKKLRFVHLAGTNGKGSTACFIASILQAAGYRTGLFTSPYIHRFHERMQMDGVSITDTELEQIVAEMRPLADTMDDHPTTFELVTAAAFAWFLQQSCDIVVLETGMGGELDATNVIESPEVSVITPIDMDHMEYLGNTVGKIAKAKAGIIKAGCPVVTAKQKPEALAVLSKTAKAHGANLTEIDLDAITPGAFDLTGQRFSYGDLDDLSISLLGQYQIENAALALTAVSVLEQRGFAVPESAKRDGLSHARWLGRFELAGENPAVIVDGGHNAQGAAALAKNLCRYFPGKKITFVMGVLADKEVEAMLSPILPLAERVYTVTPQNDRAMPAEELATLVEAQGIPAIAMPYVAAALETAKQCATSDGVVCYFGSLYSVGEVRVVLGLY